MLDYCSRCHGWWFDKTELGSLTGAWKDIPAVETLPPPNHRPTGFDCPRCGVHLVEFNYDTKRSLVKIDFCSACKGIWLDKDEFQRISRQETYNREYGNTMEGHYTKKGPLILLILAGVMVAAGLIYLLTKMF